ncbi:transmembrane protein, putative, partial [Medicago truncatula]
NAPSKGGLDFTQINMNLLSTVEVTCWHYWLFFLLRGIRNPVKRVIQKYSIYDNNDKLSDFPDFLNTKYAVQTCVLAKRWKNLWKRLTSLIIGYSHFKDLKGFEYLIHGFFGTRDRSTALQVLNFREECYVGYQSHLEWIVRYAFTHNVKRIRIDVKKVKHLHF